MIQVIISVKNEEEKIKVLPVIEIEANTEKLEKLTEPINKFVLLKDEMPNTSIEEALPPPQESRSEAAGLAKESKNYTSKLEKQKK